MFEVEEMRTFIKKRSKLSWIVYALERATKKVLSYYIGSRTNKTLNGVVTTVLLSKPKAIYTDGLKQNTYLIDKSMHIIKRYGTNHIERKNISIRTHLKRSNRKTICYSYSKSKIMLISVLKIYFWRRNYEGKDVIQ